MFNLAYLAFRVGPFILVSSFILLSIINFDFKCVIYLAGLLVALGATRMIDNIIPNVDVKNETSVNCGLISLGENNFLSKLPLSVAVYSYTFWFLFMFIVSSAQTTTQTTIGAVTKQNLSTAILQCLPIMIFFPSMILLESWWVTAHNCTPGWIYPAGSIVIGGTIGFLWGLTITSISSASQFQYIKRSGADVCSAPTKAKYHCTVDP